MTIQQMDINGINLTTWEIEERAYPPWQKYTLVPRTEHYHCEPVQVLHHETTTNEGRAGDKKGVCPPRTDVRLQRL